MGAALCLRVSKAEGLPGSGRVQDVPWEAQAEVGQVAGASLLTPASASVLPCPGRPGHGNVGVGRRGDHGHRCRALCPYPELDREGTRWAVGLDPRPSTGLVQGGYSPRGEWVGSSHSVVPTSHPCCSSPWGHLLLCGPALLCALWVTHLPSPWGLHAVLGSRDGNLGNVVGESRAGQGVETAFLPRYPGAA